VSAVLSRGRWQADTEIVPLHEPEFDRWQTAKGAAVLGAIVVLFLAAPWPREIVALAAAGILLCSQKMHSREMLGLVDWQLLVLFIGLFIVNHAMQSSGNLALILSGLESSGVNLSRPEWLFGTTVVLSNLVSNVPAVMLLLPAADPPQAGANLARTEPSLPTIRGAKRGGRRRWEPTVAVARPRRGTHATQMS